MFADKDFALFCTWHATLNSWATICLEQANHAFPFYLTLCNPKRLQFTLGIIVEGVFNAELLPLGCIVHGVLAQSHAQL